MLIKKAFVFAATGILFFAATASAHHPSGGAGLSQAGPIRTTSATTLSRGIFSLAVQAEFINLDSFSDSEKSTNAIPMLKAVAARKVKVKDGGIIMDPL